MTMMKQKKDKWMSLTEVPISLVIRVPVYVHVSQFKAQCTEHTK